MAVGLKDFSIAHDNANFSWLVVQIRLLEAAAPLRSVAHWDFRNRAAVVN